MPLSNPFAITIQAAAPAWVPGLTLDAWTALANVNTLSAVAANVGPSSTEAVMSAWNGAIFAPNYGTRGAMIHWGGGHADYYGNEVYAFNLNTLTWARIKEPYGGAKFPPNPSNGLWADSTPAAPHTYYFIHSRPSANELVISRREEHNLGGGGWYRISRLNLSTLIWTNSGADHTLSQLVNEEGGVYDSSRDAIWIVQLQQGLQWAKYLFSTDAWTTYPEPTGAYNQGPTVYVPGKDCVLFFTSSASLEYGLDCATPTTGPFALTTTGSAPASLGDPRGDMCHWSVNLGAVVYYPSRGNQIYLLIPPAGDWKSGTWVWSQRSMSGTTGAHSGSPGTYGKFQIAEWGSNTVALVNANYGGPCVAARLA